VRLAAAVCVLLVVSGATPSLPAAGPAPACATVVDGSVSVLRGPARYGLAEGARLHPADILETGDGALAQVEVDGAAVALGPATRAMLLPGAQAGVHVFVLTGWVKASSPHGGPPVEIQSPLGLAAVSDAVTVVRVSQQEEALFAESGQVTIETSPPLRLRPGEFCTRRPGQKPSAAGRPTQAFVASLPRPFLDALPSRLARFSGRDVPLKAPREFGYAEVEPWLDTAPAVRRVLVTHWAARASDPSFRRALIAGLPRHPEWDRVLFPEKFDAKAKRLP
jgi:hypothetical protein